MSMKTVCGNDLTIEDVCDVALRGEEVQLPEDQAFWERIEKSRKFLEDYIATGVPTYGVTTDFGDSCHNQISVEKAGELQRVICTYHGIGLGPKFDRETARAVVLARLNGNVKGGHSDPPAACPHDGDALEQGYHSGDSAAWLSGRIRRPYAAFLSGSGYHGATRSVL